jgi:hypothetical protein
MQDVPVPSHIWDAVAARTVAHPSPAEIEAEQVLAFFFDKILSDRPLPPSIRREATQFGQNLFSFLPPDLQERWTAIKDQAITLANAEQKPSSNKALVDEYIAISADPRFRNALNRSIGETMPLQPRENHTL